uniref:Serine/threonine-protein phosphatase 2A 55 kDa regulatory subunit B n=1 Tax=Schistosoma haematobium TaxID=6185 RepID=A0A095A1U5_SCHHA
MLGESIRWYVSQIKGSNPEDIADGDNFTCVEFNESGELLATGDKAGRVTVFKNNKDTGLYDIYCTFTSHEPEFDYLKSLEIEEKINSITWLQAYSSAHHLLSANDKTIKLWRLSERHYEAYNFNIRDDENASLWDESSDQLNMIGPPIPHIITPDKLRIPKFRKSRHLTIEARPRRFFANAHAYHINAVSVNSDQETFLSADDLRINLWHLDVTNQSFTIVDLKPSNMEDLSEVITCSRFHPVQCNILAYSTSRGLIRLCDMRYRALCDDHVLVFEDPSLSQNLGFFADIIASLSDFRFGHTGNYLLARDYLTLKMLLKVDAHKSVPDKQFTHYLSRGSGEYY